MRKESKYPLCRLLVEMSGKPIRQIAHEAGIEDRLLWRICSEGFVGIKTLAKLVGVVPMNVLDAYIERAYQMKAEQRKKQLREVCREAKSV